MNDDEFWSATEQLKLIYRWARASYVAPWALLVAIANRVIATTGPHVMLPGPPAPASLNMGVVLVGRSGAGKGVTDKLSRVVWPADIHEEGLGSGQGIAELFKEQKNPEDRINRALITVSEIDHLTALNAGQGNNTRAAIKAALTGDRLGSKGASAATTRAVPADSYRLCLSISAQFGHCGVLLDDVSGGTPQRQLWMLVTDPDMPEEPGPTPDRVLDTALPAWALSGGQTLIQYGPSEIRDYINAGLLANGRGTGDALDGHRTLTRLKVAAALAILDHRMVISAVDWELSEAIMAKSDATRDAVLEHDRQAARAKVRERAIARAAGEDFYDASRLETVKRSILRMLERDGEQAGNKLRSRLGKREKRDLFEQAIALLEADGLVFERTDEYNGAPRVRYRIGSGLTNEVRPENPSSEGVTHEVRPDPSATVTDLDSRRSPETGRPLVPCPKWFAIHIADLRDTGHATAESFAVVEAGQALGYTKGAILQAAHNHPDVKVIARTQKSSTWSLTGDAGGYKPATEWVHEYFDALPANTTVVDQDAFRAAAEARNYSWTAARAAAYRSGRIDKTGDGWLIINQAEDGTAS
ncbi:hypothetical protein [Mycolicibacterium cosmeticum]|uniref:hypothetical protein n=1 Tax=Mycolicibacterium cosmeticum TaxID=258533 RepID=UPI0032047F42